MGSEKKNPDFQYVFTYKSPITSYESQQGIHSDSLAFVPVGHPTDGLTDPNLGKDPELLPDADYEERYIDRMRRNKHTMFKATGDFFR